MAKAAAGPADLLVYGLSHLDVYVCVSFAEGLLRPYLTPQPGSELSNWGLEAFRKKNNIFLWG